MDDYILVKNGLVLTLDRKGLTGYFNILIRGGKIFLIDYDRKFNEKEFIAKYPSTQIIDAKNKIVMPGFFNSRLISSYSFNSYFFKKCNYENINSWHSLRLIDRFLSENPETLNELLKISYKRSLQNGEFFVCESSTSIKKKFFDKYFSNLDWIRQYYNLAVYDYTMLTDLIGQEKFISLGFKADEDINNYSLTSMKKTLAGNKLRLFIEASLSKKTFDSIKKVFGKHFISVLSEMELINHGTVISNPTHLSKGESEILIKKNASVLISASDYINFQDTRIDFDELIDSEMKLLIGTGYTGKSIFSELKVLSALISKNNLNSESLLKMATVNPSLVFGVANLTGTIERNKSADMMILSISDLRNGLTIPEISSEIVSEFILQNLSEKDISEVILKGEIFIKDKKDLSTDTSLILKKATEITDRLYQEGKYFEYKEKYLMRGRVDGLIPETGEESEIKSEEVFVDMTETGEGYTGDGEFTVIGPKEDEYENLRIKVKAEDISININEISSLENGLGFLDDDTDSQQITEPSGKKRILKKDHKKVESTEKELPAVITDELKDFKIKFKEDLNDRNKITENTETDKETEIKTEPVIVKSKLKFGFSDEDKKK